LTREGLQSQTKTLKITEVSSNLIISFSLLAHLPVEGLVVVVPKPPVLEDPKANGAGFWAVVELNEKAITISNDQKQFLLDKMVLKNIFLSYIRINMNTNSASCHSAAELFDIL
jgi:hypothetical protein